MAWVSSPEWEIQDELSVRVMTLCWAHCAGACECQEQSPAEPVRTTLYEQI